MTTVIMPRSREMTRADLDQAPDDGHRYELIDGALIVTPAPSLPHQRASMALSVLLYNACPDHLEVLAAPFDIALSDNTVMQPDVLVARRADLTHRDLPTAPMLAIEILSPSTALIDLNLKKARFEVAGCPSYWVLDPLKPSLIAWELQDGLYVHVADVEDDETWTATLPFPVEITPNTLIH